jgi:hypothetical protein
VYRLWRFIARTSSMRGKTRPESKEAYSTNRSLIAFPAWSSFAHAAVMAVMAFQKADYRGDLWGVAALVIIGVALRCWLRQSSQSSGYRLLLCRLALKSAMHA